jgi:cobalt-zinc-cadmium efflux system outer membrane protein
MSEKWPSVCGTAGHAQLNWHILTNERDSRSNNYRTYLEQKKLWPCRFNETLDVLDNEFPGMTTLRPGKLFVVMLSLILAGCVSHRPKPLDDTNITQALASPNKDELVREGAMLDHPRLPPLRLDFSKPLTDRELGVIAVLANPELKALRIREQVAKAQVFDAGLLPDPELTASLDHPTSGSGAVNAYNVGVSWLITALITRPAEERIAKASARQVHWDIAWQEWLVANQARLLVRRVVYLERRRAVAAALDQSEKQLINVLRHSMETKDVNTETLGTHLAGYINAHEQALSLTREAEGGRQELNRILGLPPDERLMLAADFATTRTLGSPDFLFERAEHERLDLLALRAGYASQEEKLYRAVLGQYPRFRLGLDTASDTEGVHTYGVSVSLDLPIFNRNRGAIAIEEATRERLYQEYINRLSQTRADIAALMTELTQIEQERIALSENLHELEKIEKRLAGALQRSDTTLPVYSAARATLFDKQLRLLALDQAAAEREVALDLAVGAPWMH